MITQQNIIKIALFSTITLITPIFTHAAINYDSTLVTQTHPTPIISVTDPFNNVAGNAMLVGLVIRDSNADSSTGCTYNSVAMTLIEKVDSLAAGGFMYVYGLLSPTTGTHDIVCTFGFGIADDVRVSAVSYSGVSQTSLPDASTYDTITAGSFTDNLTTVADGSWVLLFPFNDNNPNIAGTGSTQRGTSANPSWFDSNGPISPAGSYTMGASASGATKFGWIILSIAPASTTPSIFAVSTSSIDQTHRNLFSSFIVFFVSFFGMVWLFRKRN